MSRTFVHALLGIALAGSGPAYAAEDAPDPNPKAFQVGMNLSRIVDWVPTWMFVDVFKQSRPWFSTQPLKLTPDGYPLLASGQTAITTMFTHCDGRYPAGLYTVLYKGKGEIELLADAKVTQRFAGKLLASVQPTDRGMKLQITSSDVKDPIRDIRVIMPGFEATHESEPFHPKFLERLTPFTTVRFMDAQMTNNSTQEFWKDRPTVTMQTQGGPQGVALEYLVDLCNRIDANAWFCMPHRANDDYVRNFAAYVRDHLKPSLKVYVEYSNEIWNDMFSQAKYAESQGVWLNLDSRKYVARANFTSRRSVEVFKIWESVYGSTSRIVRVLPAQRTNPGLGELILTFEDAWQHADALAIADYFGGNLGQPRWSPTPPASIADVVAGCEASMQTSRPLTEQYFDLAKRHGLPLIAYEGGQALVTAPMWSQNKALQTLFDTANRDPKMRTLYLEHLAQWQSLGGGIFMSYAFCYRPSDSGRWGALEYMDQPIEDAPKYDALLSVATSD